MSFGKMKKNDEYVERKKSQNENCAKKRSDLLNVLQELVETERNFLNELKMFYDCFMNEDLVEITEPCPKEFEKRDIFQRFTPVIDFSTNLLKSFEIELSKHDNNFLECKFSHCIHQSVEKMEKTFAQYGRFYEKISNILKKVNMIFRISRLNTWF